MGRCICKQRSARSLTSCRCGHINQLNCALPPSDVLYIIAFSSTGLYNNVTLNFVEHSSAINILSISIRVNRMHYRPTCVLVAVENFWNTHLYYIPIFLSDDRKHNTSSFSFLSVFILLNFVLNISCEMRAYTHPHSDLNNNK